MLGHIPTFKTLNAPLLWVMLNKNRKQLCWKPTTRQLITSVNSLNSKGGHCVPVKRWSPRLMRMGGQYFISLWWTGIQYIWHSFIGLLFNDFLRRVRPKETEGVYLAEDWDLSLCFFVFFFFFLAVFGLSLNRLPHYPLPPRSSHQRLIPLFLSPYLPL